MLDAAPTAAVTRLRAFTAFDLGSAVVTDLTAVLTTLRIARHAGPSVLHSHCDNWIDQ
jgi:hypothetical protein